MKYRHISPIQVLYFQHVNGLPILTYNMGFVQGPESTLVSAFTSAITTFFSKAGAGNIKRISFKKWGKEYNVLFFKESPVIMVAFLSSLRKETIDLLLALFQRLSRELGLPESWDGSGVDKYRGKIREIVVETFQLRKLVREIENVNEKVRKIIDRYHVLEGEVDRLLKMSMTSTVPEMDYLKKVEKLRKKMDDLRKKYEDLTGDPVIPATYYERKIFLNPDLGSSGDKRESEAKISISITPDIASMRQRLMVGLGVKDGVERGRSAGASIVEDLAAPRETERPRPQKRVRPPPTYELDVLKKKLISLIREQEKEV